MRLISARGAPRSHASVEVGLVKDVLVVWLGMNSSGKLALVS